MKFIILYLCVPLLVNCGLFTNDNTITQSANMTELSSNINTESINDFFIGVFPQLLETDYTYSCHKTKSKAYLVIEFDELSKSEYDFIDKLLNQNFKTWDILLEAYNLDAFNVKFSTTKGYIFCEYDYLIYNKDK